MTPFGVGQIRIASFQLDKFHAYLIYLSVIKFDELGFHQYLGNRRQLNLSW